MRTTLLLPLILIGTNAAAMPPAQNERMAARVALDDLALDRAADRSVLRARVSTAVGEFCRAFADEVTPQLIRTDTSYCRDTMRQSILAEMPRDVRRAYAQAEKEAR